MDLVLKTSKFTELKNTIYMGLCEFRGRYFHSLLKESWDVLDETFDFLIMIHQKETLIYTIFLSVTFPEAEWSSKQVYGIWMSLLLRLFWYL